MDESDVELSQSYSSNGVLESTDEEFTDLDSGSGISAGCQEKDGANDFQSLPTTNTILAVCTAENALDNNNLKSNLTVTSEDGTNSQENVECVGSFLPSEDHVVQEECGASGLQDSNTVFQGFQNSTPPSDMDSIETEADDSIEDRQRNERVSYETLLNLEPISSTSIQAGPKSSSPIFGSRLSEELVVNFENTCGISESTSPVDGNVSIEELLSRLPKIPQNDHIDNSFNRSSSIDGGSRSVTSNASSSLSRSYMYSSASCGDIPNDLHEDGDHLIPRYKADGRGFCWPIDKLPLSGDRKFKENKQWKLFTDSEIGHGASGQCFKGYPVNEGFLFCVKKCKYRKEEVKAMFLAAREIHNKKPTRGANKIVSFYGATYYKPEVCIFMEYMEGGTVNDAIKDARREKKDGLDKSDCVHYLEDVLLALEFLHSKGIIHSDLRSDNVLLTASKFEAKLCDFDKAVAIDKHNSPSRDVWAGGCFLLEMLGKNYSSAWISGFSKKPDEIFNRLPADVEEDTEEVLSRCFSKDRNKCTASYVLTSAFFKNDKS